MTAQRFSAIMLGTLLFYAALYGLGRAAAALLQGWL